MTGLSTPVQRPASSAPARAHSMLERIKYHLGIVPMQVGQLFLDKSNRLMMCTSIEMAPDYDWTICAVSLSTKAQPRPMSYRAHCRIVLTATQTRKLTADHPQLRRSLAQIRRAGRSGHNLPHDYLVKLHAVLSPRNTLNMSVNNKMEPTCHT